MVAQSGRNGRPTNDSQLGTWNDRTVAIAADAYEAAVRFFERELCDHGNTSWIKARTSIHDVRQTVDQARQAYEGRSEKTAKARKWVDAFASSITFYGGVIDVLVSADPLHAGLAWGAIKFLFVGVSNHSEMVTELSKALARIGEALPRVQVDLTLYNTPWMQDAVAKLYAHILLFLQNAARWYNAGRLKRAVTSVFHPYKLTFSETVADIKLCLAEANAIAETASRAEMRGLSVALADLIQTQAASRLASEQRLYEMQTRLNDIQSASRRSEQLLIQSVQTATNQSTLMQSIKLDTGETRLLVRDLQFSSILDALGVGMLPEDVLELFDRPPRARVSWRQCSRDTSLAMQRLQGWASLPGSSVLTVRTNPRGFARASDMIVEITKVLRKTGHSTFWHLQPPGSSVGPTVGATLRNLMFQAIRQDPSIITEDPLLCTGSVFKRPHTLSELTALAVKIFSKVPRSYVVVNTPREVTNSQTAAQEFVHMLKSLYREVALAGAVMKLLVLSHDDVLQGELADLGLQHFAVTIAAPSVASRRPQPPKSLALRIGLGRRQAPTSWADDSKA